ncbi:hypothetical protein DXM26_23025 [Agrobacterium tumefaciens]|nr:hypothetical protein DXM26_23025 [Agrobacterium tumefaciens]
MNGSLDVFCKCALSLGRAISVTIDADAAMAELDKAADPSMFALAFDTPTSDSPARHPSRHSKWAKVLDLARLSASLHLK